MDFFIGGDGHEFLEGVTVGVAVEAVSFEVLNVGIVGEDFGEDLLLDLVGVFSDILDEVEDFLVLVKEVVVFGSLRHGESGLFEKKITENQDFCVCKREKLRERERR